MTKVKKGLLATLALILLCGAGFFWTYGSHLGQWLADKQSNAIDASNDQETDWTDPRYEALQDTPLLKLVPGVSEQGNNYFAGAPKWERTKDLLDQPPSEEKSRLYALQAYVQNDGDHEEWTAALVFRADTLGDNPTQMLGIQPLHYVEKSKSWQANGKPVLAVVSEPGGKLDFKTWRSSGGLSMFRFEMAHPAKAGYRSREAGLLALDGKDLSLALRYQSALEPEDGSCSVGSNTPCRKVLNEFASNYEDGDQSTAGWPPVTLESNVVSEHDNQTRKFKLKYDPKKNQFLLDDGRHPEQVNALSIHHAEAFLASLANPAPVKVASNESTDPVATASAPAAEAQPAVVSPKH